MSGVHSGRDHSNIARFAPVNRAETQSLSASENLTLKRVSQTTSMPAAENFRDAVARPNKAVNRLRSVICPKTGRNRGCGGTTTTKLFHLVPQIRTESQLIVIGWSQNSTHFLRRAQCRAIELRVRPGGKYCGIDLFRGAVDG